MGKSKFNFIGLIMTKILVLLGFASCSEFGGGVQEYGCPYVSLKAEGTVVNESNEPIKGIQVQVLPSDSKFETDADGKYVLNTDVGMTPTSFDLVFTDVDGAENGGEFETKVVKYSDIDLVDNPDSHGYKATVNVTLNEK